jgi:transcriptional regulator with XRE-family HTH domain
MSHIGNNIKKIRGIKKLSQSGFADLFGLTRASIGAYEEGRADPKIDTIKQIADHFGLSLDQLITKELTVNELYHFDIFRDEFKEVKGKVGKTASPTPLNETRIPFVNVVQRRDYCAQYTNKGFINSLPALMLPYALTGSLRAFSHNDQAMQYMDRGIFQDDVVIGNAVEPDELKRDHMGQIMVAVTDTSVVVRRLESTGKSLVFSADNPNTRNVKIPLDDILELWEVVTIISSQLHRPTDIEQRILALEQKVK